MTVTDMSDQDRHQTTSASLLRACVLSMAIMTAGMADAASPSDSETVHLRMQFLEVDRHQVLGLGIDWRKPENEGGIAFGVSSDEGAAGADIDQLIEALEQEGKVDILAAPNLIAAQGEAASFLVGGEVPVPIPNNGSDQVEYKPFGISVEFTPTLQSDDRIDVMSRLEITSVDPGDVASNDVQLSSFTSNIAETTLDLASGQSFAIVGLFDRKQSSDFADQPDLPIIGSLINSARFQRKETELIILVAARSADGNG